MMRRLDGFAENVVAVAAGGRITRDDYQGVLIPAVDAALRGRDKVRFFYRIEQDFAGVEPGAAWEDFRVAMEHLTRWERIAVVTDVAWIGHTIEAFGFMMPGKVRVFSLKDDAEARAWIAER